MTSIRRAGAAVALLAVASGASAQELTIDQLVDTALRQAPRIRAARAAIGVAQGQVTQAGLRANPVFAGSQQEQIGGMDRETMVEVEWPLELFRRSGRVAAARSELEAATLSVSDQERLLAFAVREQAGRLLAARRTLTIADQALASARQMRELVERRASEGAIPQIEANLTTVEMWRLEADRNVAAAEADVVAARLRALAGLPAEDPLMLAGNLEAVVMDPLAAPPGADATLQARTDIREAAARVSVAEARVDAARREGRFDVSLFGSYSRMKAGFPQRAFDASGMLMPIEGVFHNVAVGAMAMVPLFNRNQGAIASAEAEREGARDTLAARERDARAELDAAVALDREARRAVELYSASILALAKRNNDVIYEAYELGSVPLTDLLANQRYYLGIEEAYTETLLKAYEARTALRRARGETR